MCVRAVYEMTNMQQRVKARVFGGFALLCWSALQTLLDERAAVWEKIEATLVGRDEVLAEAGGAVLVGGCGGSEAD